MLQKRKESGLKSITLIYKLKVITMGITKI